MSNKGNPTYQSPGGKRGFTLIELMGVVVLIGIGMIGVTSLIQQISIKSRLVTSKLAAAYLAQEGIEIVRNLRDSNWLEPGPPSWNTGLEPGDWEADYNDQALSAYTSNPLNLNASGFYSYSAGTPTKFRRKITIFDPAGNTFKVAAEVSWEEFGQAHSVKVLEKIYDWR